MVKSTKEHLKNYEEYLRIQNFSPFTVKAYLLGLRQFLEFRQKYGITEKIDQEQARQFILLKYDNGAKWQTINNVYSALRKYFKEVIFAEWTTKKIKRPRRERTVPVLINKEDVIKIIEHCNMYKYQVFITLLYSTGIRLSEARYIRFEDIDRSAQRIIIRKGKGSKGRYVDITPVVLDLVTTYYIRERPKHYLFNGKYKGRTVASSSVQRAVRNAVRAAKILKKVNTHTFRHCFATHHLEQGTNIVYLQKQMGHKHLKTTAKYINLCQNYHCKIVHPIQTMKVNYLSKSRR